MAQIIDRVDQDKYMAVASRILSKAGVVVRGRPLWLSADIHWDCAYPGAITIGDRCVISGRVTLLTHDFSLDRVAELKRGRSDQELIFRGPISIGDYAFIGWQSIILPGVTIGRGSIVGAGSVVTKDVPDGTVVAGNPARVLDSTDNYWDRSADRFEWQNRR
ncbi:acyltransferase [Mycobacterium sp. CPCC 205372]|uniref:Acyltransferase n=1 Tax=Mycobacterium hippophais TaxID=3016340 RepID=A0ABT4PRT8_9MYCO|nr:acyltransferase [Mycobacterium hippophais]MCZ8379268.1 acyltransferase [Mycobacterium hippophais]